MSYRKKHFPPKTEKNQAPPVPPLPEYYSSGVERSICSDKLTSGLPYQRPVDEKEVDRLIQEWDERLLEPLTVSFRDGRFNVVDGQHRIAAMRKMNGGSEVIAACKVYSGLTYQQEADLCYKLDKAKKRLSLSQSTNALAESGEDTEVLAVKALVEQSGFVWALNQRITTTRATINAWQTAQHENREQVKGSKFSLGIPADLQYFARPSLSWSYGPRAFAAILSGWHS